MVLLKSVFAQSSKNVCDDRLYFEFRLYSFGKTKDHIFIWCFGTHWLKLHSQSWHPKYLILVAHRTQLLLFWRCKGAVTFTIVWWIFKVKYSQFNRNLCKLGWRPKYFPTQISHCVQVGHAYSVTNVSLYLSLYLGCCFCLHILQDVMSTDLWKKFSP